MRNRPTFANVDVELALDVRLLHFDLAGIVGRGHRVLDLELADETRPVVEAIRHADARSGRRLRWCPTVRRWGARSRSRRSRTGRRAFRWSSAPGAAASAACCGGWCRRCLRRRRARCGAVVPFCALSCRDFGFAAPAPARRAPAVAPRSSSVVAASAGCVEERRPAWPRRRRRSARRRTESVLRKHRAIGNPQGWKPSVSVCRKARRLRFRSHRARAGRPGGGCTALRWC